MCECHINKNSELDDTGKWEGEQSKTWGQDSLGNKRKRLKTPKYH